jgi:sugar phosphate isomerase/epimerase
VPLKISISEYTTFPATLAQDLVAYRDGGATGIGLMESKLRADPDAYRRVRESGLVVTNCSTNAGAVLPTAGSAETSDQHLHRLCDGIRFLSQFDPVCVFFRLGGFGDLDPQEGRRLAREGLRVAGQVAEAVGVQLAIEVVPRPPLGFATTIARVAEILDDAAAGPSVGLMVDTFLLPEIDGWEAQLRTHGEKLMAVHVADRKAQERSLQDRAVPGEGALDLVHIFEVLRQIGWDGWYDIEIISDNGRYRERFPDSLWELPPGQLASRAVRGLEAVWACLQSADG